MRPLLLSTTFLLLAAALFFLWPQRFQRVAQSPVWSMDDLRGPNELAKGVEWTSAPGTSSLRIGSAPGEGGFALRLPLPDAPPARALHLSFQLKALDLQQGPQVWQNGRLLIEWRKPADPTSAPPETDPIAAVRFGDVDPVHGIVAVPLQGPAVPSLRLENLGLSGQVELSGLKVVVVEERPLWIYGRWALLAGFLGWGMAAVRCGSSAKRLPSLLAAAVWVLMGVNFVIPGPWKVQRPMVLPFQLGDTSGPGGGAWAPAAETSPMGPQVIRASGDIPVQGSLPLRVKFLITRARPVLHALMLAAPAFLIAALAGRRAAWFLSGLLAVLIELSQWAFGYGFGMDDVIDLVCDAAGIGLGVAACAWWVSRGPGRRWKWLHGSAAAH